MSIAKKGPIKKTAKKVVRKSTYDSEPKRFERNPQQRPPKPPVKK